MKYPNIRNHVILEGAWGLGKTSVAKQFSTQFDYRFIPEPSHLADTEFGSVTNLQEWYRRAHQAHEAHLSEKTPCVLERSILSLYAFEYAQDGRLPSEEEMLRIRLLLEDTRTMVVVLSPASQTYDADVYVARAVKTVQALLSDRERMKRYFEFYEQILPWAFGIVPLLLAPIEPSEQRDASMIASEIREAIGGQRVAQVNVVCMDAAAPITEPRVLLMKRTVSRGGFWQAITGGIHPGEPLPTVALREVEEETRIALSVNDLLPTGFSHSFPGGTGYRLTEYAFAALIRHPEDLHHSDEHDEIRWVSVEEAKTLMIYESNRVALDHAVEAIKKRPVR